MKYQDPVFTPFGPGLITGHNPDIQSYFIDFRKEHFLNGEWERTFGDSITATKFVPYGDVRLAQRPHPVMEVVKRVNNPLDVSESALRALAQQDQQRKIITKQLRKGEEGGSNVVAKEVIVGQYWLSPKKGYVFQVDSVQGNDLVLNWIDGDYSYKRPTTKDALFARYQFLESYTPKNKG